MKVKTINSKYCFICSPRFATFLHLHKIPQVYISTFGTKKIHTYFHLVFTFI
jgi:hypothetical protein